MSNSMALVAAFAGMTITALFNTFVFNMSRSSPNNILVRSDMLASLTALAMTSLIVFSLAFLASALHGALGSIPLSLGGALASFVGLSFICWMIFGTSKVAQAGAPRAEA
ncbi:MAG: hypothetical protein R3D67_00100 [Hyphomicrobiaceae bacterium]